MQTVVRRALFSKIPRQISAKCRSARIDNSRSPLVGGNPRWLSAGKEDKAIAAASKAGEEEEEEKETLFNIEYLETIPLERTRNFSIIAHIDHGKSTLADRLLEYTTKRKVKRAQVLDSLAVERERGITVKSATAAMIYHPKSTLANPVSQEQQQHLPFLLNMVDTPGHVDFQFEVQRALGSCQGALLLVDSTQGVQAQTISNFRIAREVGLVIVPCLTKLDLSHSDPARCLEQLHQAFGFEEKDVLWSSARTGEGVEEILQRIIAKVHPPPAYKQATANPVLTSTGVSNKVTDPGVPVVVVERPSRALIVDSWHDRYQGVVCLLNVADGDLKKGNHIALSSAPPGKTFTIQEVGVLTPEPMKAPRLKTGQVGYMLAHIKDTQDARVGEHVCAITPSSPVPTFPETIKRMSPIHAKSRAKIFASVFPSDSENFNDLKRAMERLALNDASVSMQHEASGALGQGFRCGFLGMLHMEVFFQRLFDEFDMDAITTAPTVPYKAIMKSGETINVVKPFDLPDPTLVAEYLEPMVKATLVGPHQYMGDLIKLFSDRRAKQEEVKIMEQDVILTYIVPWQEAVSDLFDQVKSVTSGYGHLDFEDAPYRQADVVRVDLLLNGELVEALSFICHRSVAERRGRHVALKLKEEVPMQQFEVAIQAAIGGKIIARERVKAMRKDVLTKSGKTVGGGDVSRKRKLLDKQKRGKKKLKTIGSVQLPQKAFLAVLSRG